jgi:cytochrome c-type biogenesis protein CcmE
MLWHRPCLAQQHRFGTTMKSMRTKLAIAGILLCGAFGYLALAGMKQGWVYFVDVDHYLADGQFKTQRVRLHGKVAEDGFSATAGSLTANFNLSGASHTLPIVYRGTIPDMFGPGKDVVVEGSRDGSGVFRADVLMTKCASKYEAGSPHKNGSPQEQAAAKAGA